MIEGYIIGLLTAILILITEMYLGKQNVRQIFKPIEDKLKSRGSIIMPKDDAEEARDEI